jgi:hypothetical protein
MKKGEKEDRRFTRNIHLFPEPLQASDRPGCEWCVWVIAPDVSGDRDRPWVLKTRSGSCFLHRNPGLPPVADLLSILAKETPLPFR